MALAEIFEKFTCSISDIHVKHVWMKYDLNLLPVFVALMEERSVTRAANRLGMTQPALSNALGRLRDMLHDPLFIRERYGIRPTPRAEEIAPTIEAALARLDDVVVHQQDFDPTHTERRFPASGCA